MSRQKIARFAEISARDNVVEPGKKIIEEIRGNWQKHFFRNENDITIEVACGRGEYAVGLARLFPDQNFIGVDLKGERIWKGSSTALEENLSNVGFLRVHLLELSQFFGKEEISAIWITFPDPRPKARDAKRRITHPRFLEIYKDIIKPGGTIYFKTDNTALFEYTLEILQQRNDIEELKYTFDLYHSELEPECFEIRTRYEQKFSKKGHDIKYLRFKFK